MMSLSSQVLQRDPLREETTGATTNTTDFSTKTFDMGQLAVCNDEGNGDGYVHDGGGGGSPLIRMVFELLFLVH